MNFGFSYQGELLQKKTDFGRIVIELSRKSSSSLSLFTQKNSLESLANQAVSFHRNQLRGQKRLLKIARSLVHIILDISIYSSLCTPINFEVQTSNVKHTLCDLRVLHHDAVTHVCIFAFKDSKIQSFKWLGKQFALKRTNQWFKTAHCCF